MWGWGTRGTCEDICGWGLFPCVAHAIVKLIGVCYIEMIVMVDSPNDGMRLEGMRNQRAMRKDL